MTGTRSAGSGAGLAVGLAVFAIALSAAPRIALAAGILPLPARPFVWSDVLATYVERLAGGRVPYAEAFFEYPPLVGYVAGFFARVAGGPVLYLLLWSAVTAAAAAAVALLLARAAGAPRAIRYWSLSPQLLLYGAMNWDVAATAFLVAALVLSRQRKRIAALFALAAGAMVKAFPAAVGPLEIERARRRDGIGAAVAGATAFVSVAFVIAAPSLVGRYSSIDGARYVAGLVNFDSIFGLVLAALEGMGVHRADLILAAISIGGSLVTYGVAIRRVGPTTDPARSALLGVLAVLLWSRLYSPQYSIWVLPFFALLPIPARHFAMLSLADVLVFVTVYPLTLAQWDSADPIRAALLAVLAAGIVLRHAALILTSRAAAR